MNKQRLAGTIAAILAGLACTGAAVAGDVGGQVHSSPGTITLRLEWGNSFQNAKEIQVTGDGAYKFGVNIRNNTKYRVVGKSAPAGWGCLREAEHRQRRPHPALADTLRALGEEVEAIA